MFKAHNIIIVIGAILFCTAIGSNISAWMKSNAAEVKKDLREITAQEEVKENLKQINEVVIPYLQKAQKILADYLEENDPKYKPEPIIKEVEPVKKEIKEYDPWGD